MSFLKNLIKQHWPVLFLVAANIISFRPFYFRGLLPFPGDLLVSFYFPWNSGGFAGYNSWTTHKELIASDAIRALFPWKNLVMEQILAGHFPLWNPYNFSGTPLLANLQSSVFFPGNIFYFLMPPLSAWILQVLTLLFLLGIFTYIFLRSQGLSALAAAFGGLAVSNITYLLNWHELLVITQTLLFLPLGLWLVNKYREKQWNFYLLLLAPVLTLAVFGGHAQTALYFYAIIFLFALFRRVPIKWLLFTVFFSLILAAIQLGPSLELYFFSAREGANTAKLFAEHIFPWRNLITILAPDFFGNPVTGNFWGWDYHNSLTYVGIVALVFALLAIVKSGSDRNVRFFLLLSFLGAAFSLAPLAYLFIILRIPIFSTGIAARTIFLFQFGFCILAAYGLNWWLKKRGAVLKEISRPLLLLFLSYLILWLFVFIKGGEQLAVSRRNLLLPSGIFILTVVILAIPGTIRRLWYFAALAIFTLAIWEYARYFNKIEPFAPQAFAYPEHPVLQFLQKTAGFNRFAGQGTAQIDVNFATYYGIYDPQGYDPLYIRRYGELLAASQKGEATQDFSRADAMLPPSESPGKERLLDLLGVKYLLDKKEDIKPDWQPDRGKFPAELYTLAWKQDKWIAYERKTALPRAFLTGNYEIIRGKGEIIKRLYDPAFDYHNRLILEGEPGIKPEAGGAASAEIISYGPGEVMIKTRTDKPKLLFLSDTFYPGWQAEVNGIPWTVLRADYTFRAVALPAGEQMVLFAYRPLSFLAGAIISGLGFFLWLWLLLKSWFAATR